MKTSRIPGPPAVIGLLFAWAGALSAQELSIDPVPPGLRPDRNFEIEITPYLWAASLKGSAAAHGISGDIDATFRDTIEEDGCFVWDVAMHGMLLGASVRF